MGLTVPTCLGRHLRGVSDTLMGTVMMRKGSMKLSSMKHVEAVIKVIIPIATTAKFLCPTLNSLRPPASLATPAFQPCHPKPGDSSSGWDRG